MSFFRRIYRLLSTAAVFAYSIVEVLLKRPHSRPERAAWLCQIGNRLLRSQDITFTTIGPVPTHGAVISNHISYVDILVHASMRPCVFVSKAELRKTPVLGWISMMAGTVYVVRGGGGSAAQAAQGMAKGFRDGLPVVFFPEGTTGVTDVPAMPFRSGLLAQSLDAGAPIVPCFIHYDLDARDLARGKSVRNDIAWGPQTLLQHLWNFAGLHGVHATVHFAEQPIRFSPEAYANRKIAAAEAQAAVVKLSTGISATEAPLAPSQTGSGQ